MYAFEWSQLTEQDREQHELRPFPYLDQLRLERPLSPFGGMVYRMWSMLSNGRQGGGMSIGNIAYSEASFYLERAWRIGPGPLCDRIIGLIYRMDAAFQNAAVKSARNDSGA